MGEVALRRLSHHVGAVIGDRALRATGDHRREPGGPELERRRDEVNGPDGPHQQQHLATDGLDQVAGLASGEGQAVEPREVHHQRDVDHRGRHQVGDRHRVEGDGHPLGDRVGADHLLPQLAPGREDLAADLVGQAAGEEGGVERRQGLALVGQGVPEVGLQRRHVGWRPAQVFALVARRVHLDDQLLGGVGGGAEDVARVHQPRRVASKRLEQRLALPLPVTVDLVEYQDDRAAGLGQRPQRRDLALGQVAVDDEEHQVGPRRHLRGQPLPRVAVHLVDPGSVDQVDAAVPVGLPAPALRPPGLPVQRAGREPRLAEQCVEQRRLADADPPEGDDVDVPLLQPLQHGLHLGVVVGERLAYLLGHAAVLEELPQALPGQREVRLAAPLSRGLRRAFRLR